MNEKMTHRGEILEKVIRKSGYPLTKLAEKLAISRNTFYHRFKEANLNYWFIIQVGKVIHYDFSNDFPELKQQAQLVTDDVFSTLGNEDQFMDLAKMEVKYRSLLEKYMHLLEILVRLANKYGLYGSKQAILKLLEEESIVLTD